MAAGGEKPMAVDRRAARHLALLSVYRVKQYACVT